ncbi:hypothetical protein ACPV5O_24860 [Vibrio maritimus]|uniref:hypothetical protein n=1 Tax=Vibrio maritimus TaxID=990268 RepID=UPI0040687234
MSLMSVKINEVTKLDDADIHYFQQKNLDLDHLVKLMSPPERLTKAEWIALFERLAPNRFDASCDKEALVDECQAAQLSIFSAKQKTILVMVAQFYHAISDEQKKLFEAELLTCITNG